MSLFRIGSNPPPSFDDPVAVAVEGKGAEALRAAGVEVVRVERGTAGDVDVAGDFPQHLH